MSRTSTSNPWTYKTRDPRFNCGEAVSLKYVGSQAVDFQWQSSNTPLMAYSEAIPQNFVYNEEMDYIPVYIRLDQLNQKNRAEQAELGLFINDVCYGAEVIIGDSLQINAYVSDPALLDGNVEFRYWEPSMKSASKSMPTYAVFDFKTSRYQNRTFSFGENKSFYSISLNSKDLADGNLPIKSSLEGNYPNPFNPETNIKYSVAKDSNVKLEVYNVKGQLVKTLLNEKQTPGFKTVLWRGDDNSGKKVSSGIYFYRLSTDHSTSTKKMILMK